MLPEGFREVGSAAHYPLPSNRADLLTLMQIPLGPHQSDSGTIYLGRVLKKWKSLRRKRLSAELDVERRREKLINKQDNLRREMGELVNEARNAVNQVKVEAEKQIANLSDLFALGRKGLEGQMKAHLDGTEWKDERISARDFRECFRMVTQAVHSLGVPSNQRDKAREAIIQEAAAAAQDTKEALALAPGGEEPEVTH